MTRLLLIGAQGMLGRDLVEVFNRDPGYKLTAWAKSDLDITNQQAISQKINQLSPEIIINAAAFTAVDECEQKVELCNLINGAAVGYLAQAAAGVGAVMVHFSTDYVFDGQKKEGYLESDRPHPISAYGRSKALGERELTKHLENFYLIRIAWLFGHHGPNFVETMLSRAQSQQDIKVVNDQYGSPSYALDIAVAAKKIIDQKMPSGIYHLTNAGVTTWYQFAQKIFELAKINIKVNPCATAAFPRPAPRPKYSILLNTKLPPLRSWEEALEDYLASRKK